jgi:hypothetical protein
MANFGERLNNGKRLFDQSHRNRNRRKRTEICYVFGNIGYLHILLTYLLRNLEILGSRSPKTDSIKTMFQDQFYEAFLGIFRLRIIIIKITSFNKQSNRLKALLALVLGDALPSFG